MKSLFKRFVREEQGQDLIEYALLAGLISIGSIVGYHAHRHQPVDAFQHGREPASRRPS